jgi:pyrroline-5-carboxylate reductase
MKLTIIGPGKMALALAKGLEKEHELTIVGRNGEKLLKFTKQLSKHAKTALLDRYSIDGQTIILCVKPHVLEEVSSQLKGKAETIYSVLAGTKIQQLQKSLKANYYIRTMPNLAAEFFASMSTLTGDSIKKEEAEQLFQSIGQTLWVESEKELDIATAIAGSGPAYLALVAEALADGGVKEGLKRSDAMQLVKGLFIGFAPLLQENHPALIKDGVMSPAGTTAAGYTALEEKGTRDAFIKAVQKAFEKTKL